MIRPMYAASSAPRRLLDVLADGIELPAQRLDVGSTEMSERRHVGNGHWGVSLDLEYAITGSGRDTGLHTGVLVVLRAVS